MASSSYRLISTTEYYIPVGNKTYRKTEVLEEVIEKTTNVDITTQTISERSNESRCPSETYFESHRPRGIVLSSSESTSDRSSERHRSSGIVLPNSSFGIYQSSETYRPSETSCPGFISNSTTPQGCTCQYHLVELGSMSPRSFARHH